MHQGVGAVVDVEELAQGRAGPPDRQGRAVIPPSLVGFADQGRQDVAGAEVEVVARPVEIGRHGGDEVAAVLAAIGLAELEARDLGDRVPFVGGLQRSRQQRRLRDRLRGQLGIDAARSEKEQLLDPDSVGALHDIGLDHEVLVEELGRPGVVGEDAPDARRREKDRLRPGLPHPALDLILTSKIEHGAIGGQHLAVLRAEASHQGRADHAAVAGDPHPLALQGVERLIRHCGAAPVPR